MNFVIFANGAVMVLLGGLMIMTAAIFPDTHRPFLDAALVSGFTGALVCLAVSHRLTGFRLPHAFLLTASLWITAALAGALPLWFWGMSFTDAVFESVSGITTTGSTVLTHLDTVPRGIHLWRGLLQWLGGIGFIVAGIAFLPMLRIGGMQLFRTESSERGEKELPSATRVAEATVWVYLGLSLACAAVYFLGGMSFFDAVIHAMTTLSTGGYSTSDASFGQFQSGFLQWSAVGFMAAGGLPMAMYVRILKGKGFNSEQVPVFLATFLLATLALTVWRVWTVHAPVLETLRLVAFNVMSVMTTTGYATTDYTVWGTFAVVLFLALTVAGGCTGSTAGGVKFMRWIILFRALKGQMRLVHSPHAVTALRYQGSNVGDDVLNGVMAFFLVFVLTVAAITLGLSLLGLDASTSISGAITAVANVGPGVGPLIGPAGTFTSLPDGAKWLLDFGMYAGRLELMTVYVLLTAGFWAEAL